MSYETGETVVEVHESISDLQFNHAYEILGRTSERYKSWCEHFVFTVPAGKSPKKLLSFLRRAKKHHTYQTTQTWKP